MTVRVPLLLTLAACTAGDDTAIDTDTGVPTVPPTDFGFVYSASEPGLGFSDAGAVFRRALPHAFDCEERAVEGCTVLTCVGDDPLPYEPVDAGPLTITGAAEPIALSFTAGDGYDGVFLQDEELFSGGETIAASAPGADGPAFELSVVAPTAVTVTGPAWPSGSGRLTIPRDSGFSLAWTGASAGSVVTNFSDNSQAISVRCAFPATAGSGSVPSAALLEFPVGGGFLDVEVRSEDAVQVGTWLVGLNVSTHARVSAESLAIASVRFE